MRLRMWWAAALWAVVLAGGCRQAEVVKEYSRPLPPGVPALRLITDPAEMPDLRAAYATVDASLGAAMRRSLEWFSKPSTVHHFPVQGITHEQARASVFAFGTLLQTSANANQFVQSVTQEFDVYTSVGWDGSGTVLFTGYYTPTFNASATPTSEYRFPLYKRPADLVSDPLTGVVKGRQVGDIIVSYPTRAQIEQSDLLKGHELVWLKDRLDVYIIHVNGSAKLLMTDGSSMYVGYDGNNGHDYTSIGDLLIEAGRIDPDRKSVPTIRNYFAQHPSELDHYLRQNDRFVFFKEYPGDNWPAGSLGFRVTPLRSLATDKTTQTHTGKSLFPRACVTLVSTQLTASAPGSGGASGASQRSFQRFMVDQDTGGAIQAPGRGDIYMGIGQHAEAMAGRQVEEGRLYYFILKPARVQAWLERMGG